MADPTWRDRAACLGVDPELFFPHGYSDQYAPQIAEAKAVCGDCPVRAECLADALDGKPSFDTDGIRAGLDPDQRTKLRRLRQRIAARQGEPQP